MIARKSSKRSTRRGSIATAVAVVLIVGGVGSIGMSIASQEGSIEVPAASDGSRAAIAIVDGSESWLRINSSADEPSVSSDVVGPIMARSKPTTVDIPSIGVHSAIQDLGLDKDDALEVPAPGPLYDNAAWYRYSPTPGSLGPAILLGHADSAASGPSVFFRLGELRAGDRVSVTRSDDSVAVFVVDEVHSYAKDDFPTDLVYSDINHAGLRLLTCGGAFDNSTGHYLDNIVVFASLVGTRES